MKKFVLIFISALICGAMLTNCKRAEQKNNLVVTSNEIVSCEMEEVFRKWVYDRLMNDAIVSSNVNDEIVSCEMEEAFRKWVHERIKGDVILTSNVTSDEIVSCEMEKAFRKWVYHKIRERL